MTEEPQDRTTPASGGAEPRRDSPKRSDGPSRADGPPPAAKKPDAGKGEPRTGKDAAGPETGPHFVGTGMFWGLVVGVLLAVLVIVFAAQNTQSATVKVFTWDWSSPIFVVVLISLIVGVVLDEIVGLLYRSRKRRRLAEREELRRLRGTR